jgi:peptidoglycan hydrolase-like protein with peptidoglycan-binding domain
LLCVSLPGKAALSQEPVQRPGSAATAHAGAKSGEHARKITAKKNSRKRQQVIEARRVRQIQTALIRENYLRGRADGVWDERSKRAMARFQSDNHWQSRLVPDSRALIKLGLGPDYSGLLNPETAAITFVPDRVRAGTASVFQP